MELEKLREVIAGVLSVDPKEITTETTFLEDLGADSLDVYQIIMGIEEAFHIEIPAERAERITTVGEAVELIKNSRE
ncbi:MAG: acyl carrier protein [Lachnospiraceae bacterium]|nr:acyl carrier protein [Lachnospiraceae bacterium]